MKLSEMPLDKARECMVELTPLLGALVSDPEVMAFFGDKEGKKGANPIVEMISFVGKLMQDHYEALVCILAALSGESQGKIRGMSLGNVIQMAKSVYDEDLQRFFTA